MKKVLSIVLILAVLILIGCEEEAAIQSESMQEVEVGGTDAIDHSVWDKLKGEIVGKSDKDYQEVTNREPSKVRNDNTGKWKKNTISESIDIEEYILSYKDLYMAEGDIHFIINFNYSTTTVISELNGLVYVDIKEYAKKEEHDASTIGSGEILKSYIIYPDGDIEEV